MLVMGTSTAPAPIHNIHLNHCNRYTYIRFIGVPQGVMRGSTREDLPVLLVDFLEIEIWEENQVGNRRRVVLIAW